jgi:hypothetical protein
VPSASAIPSGLPEGRSTAKGNSPSGLHPQDKGEVFAHLPIATDSDWFQPLIDFSAVPDKRLEAHQHF